MVDTDFTAAEGDGYLGFVKVWLVDSNSASSQLLPAQQALATPGASTVPYGLTALHSSQPLTDPCSTRSLVSTPLTPLSTPLRTPLSTPPYSLPLALPLLHPLTTPQVLSDLRARLANCTALVQPRVPQQQGGELAPPPPAAPERGGDSAGCPLRVGNATLTVLEDETPPSPPVKPPPPQPPLQPPSPSLPPNLQCLFTECEVLSDDEVRRREAEAVGSGAGPSRHAPWALPIAGILALGTTHALGRSQHRLMHGNTERAHFQKRSCGLRA